MTACHHTGANPFRHPGADDEVADLCFDAHEVACAEIEARRMARVNPERIGVRDFVQPFGVGAARVYLYGKPEGRDQNVLVFRKARRVDVALDVSRDGVLSPAPLAEGP